MVLETARSNDRQSLLILPLVPRPPLTGTSCIHPDHPFPDPLRREYGDVVACASQRTRLPTNHPDHVEVRTAEQPQLYQEHGERISSVSVNGLLTRGSFGDASGGSPLPLHRIASRLRRGDGIFGERMVAAADD